MLAAFVPLMVATGLTAGCELFARHEAEPGTLPPFLLRMRDTYPELASGRFLCLAHFESPDQADLFRVTNADGVTDDRPQPVVGVRHSRSETGGGGLHVLLENAGDELRFDGERSRTLALMRDWRDYALLLFSIHGPPAGARLRFSVRSGTDLELEYTRTIDVAPGWNLYRIDLDEIGDEVDLADVRCLTWRADTTETPLECFLDDVIIADNTRYVLGEGGGNGELYAFERGCGLHVGAHERFELVFTDGLVSGWYADTRQENSQVPPSPTSIELPRPPRAAPPVSQRPNLTVRSGLGPHPVPLTPDWYEQRESPVRYDDPELYALWGSSVIAQQWLREATPTRIVIQAQWRFASDLTSRAGEQTPDDAFPAHNWQYVIYPTGEVYTTVASVAGEVGWPMPLVGYAVALPGRRGFRRVDLGRDGDVGGLGVLMTRRGDGADLLWTPHEPAMATHVAELVAPDRRRLALVLGELAACPVVESTHLLRFYPWDMNGQPEAKTFARDYTTPATLRTTVGTVRRDVAGDLNADGYNEAEGCHELALDAGVLRFTFDPGQLLRHAPRFRVHGVATDAPYWVYVDGQRLREVGRDRSGAGFFTIPHALSQPVDIEVHAEVQPPEPPSLDAPSVRT
ncbi:MAG: hypothetical protein JXO22_10495 [Phycisphaerae bacterium]|nr:hypothetical protein [Phycisphaerae bacterium]